HRTNAKHPPSPPSPPASYAVLRARHQPLPHLLHHDPLPLPHPAAHNHDRPHGHKYGEHRAEGDADLALVAQAAVEALGDARVVVIFVAVAVVGGGRRVFVRCYGRCAVAGRDCAVGGCCGGHEGGKHEEEGGAVHQCHGSIATDVIFRRLRYLVWIGPISLNNVNGMSASLYSIRPPDLACYRNDGVVFRNALSPLSLSSSSAELVDREMKLRTNGVCALAWL
ncbi:hypothetical protein EDC01DRAFT_319052, partial [Geopyxis carbonaria]